MALKWLMWKGEGIHIQHARNMGEKVITVGSRSYKVDGYHEETKTVFEFFGCYYHGCPVCYRDREKKPAGFCQTMEDAYQETLTRVAELEKAGYEVVTVWECEVKRMLKEDPEMAEFFEKTEIPQPINPRDALKGGRTNATRLLYECKPGEKMGYVDVVSLYPWGVKWTEFPVGHPEIITENFQPITAESNPYFGLISCTIVPARKLLHPVLPYACNGKLYFPLCRTCARLQAKDFCTHTDEERALTGTWVSTELNKALQMGYRVVKVHSVWHYSETDKHDGKDQDTGLFTKYINCFLKLKIEASGWPSWVKTDADRSKFLQECYDREGIVLDPEKIQKNSGLRSLAKLCLNSFWGKFGQRPNLPKDEFVIDPAKFSNLIFDDSNIVHNVQVLNESMVHVTYSKTEEEVPIMGHSNPVIAAFTTANCRLRLYEELEKLGECVAYFDTDSCIYITRDAAEYQPALGSFLGDMTDELEDYGCGSYIDQFVGAGAKNYAFRVRKPDGSTATKVKIRGFTLNYHAAAHLNLENLRRKVEAFVQHGEKQKTLIVQPQIQRTKERQLVTADVGKEYSVVYDKRWVLDDFSTLPFGYCMETAPIHYG